MNIWRDNYCLENDYDGITKLSIIPFCYSSKKEFKLNANRPLEDICMNKFEQFGPCVSGETGAPQVNKFEHVWSTGGQGGEGVGSPYDLWLTNVTAQKCFRFKI